MSTSHAGLRTKQQHFILSSARAHCFVTTSKSRKALVATHLKTTASNLGHHFLYLYLRMRTYRSLSNNTKLLLKIAKLEIKSVCVHSVLSGTRHLKRLREVPIINMNTIICEQLSGSMSTPRSLDRESWLCHPSRELG